MLAEYTATDDEHTYVVALPPFLHLTDAFSLVAAPGVEFASGEEDDAVEAHNEESGDVTETEFFTRFGAIYEFGFDRWSIGPQVHADLVSGHWTWVYGVAFGIGF